MTFYPPAVDDRFNAPRNAGPGDRANASGTSASFVCGSFAGVTLCIDDASNRIDSARFRSNGCGFMIASADAVCEWLTGKSVTDLHGLDAAELSAMITTELGGFPPDRVQCAEIVFEALRDAMAAYRRHRIEEFQGERALICTCFGVSEDAIVAAIADHELSDVDEVAALCRAGSGCGSCRMLIAELIDSRQHF